MADGPSLVGSTDQEPHTNSPWMGRQQALKVAWVYLEDLIDGLPKF